MKKKKKNNPNINLIIDPNHPEAGDGGVVPPVEYRWKKGESPIGGRKPAGTSVIEWMNILQETPEDELEIIARNKRLPPNKRAAAGQWLEILAGHLSLADFECYAQGKITLKELQDAGIAVRRLKKARERVTTTKDGGTETVREIELSEKSGECLDRIMNRTVGTPKGTIEQKITVETDADTLIRKGEALVGMNPDERSHDDESD